MFEQILIAVGSGLGGILATMIGFWLLHLRNLMTREETNKLIEDAKQQVKQDSLYMQERMFLMESISQLQKQHVETKIVLDKIAEVIGELKIALTRFSTELNNLMKRQL